MDTPTPNCPTCGKLVPPSGSIGMSVENIGKFYCFGHYDEPVCKTCGKPVCTIDHIVLGKGLPISDEHLKERCHSDIGGVHGHPAPPCGKCGKPLQDDGFTQEVCPRSNAAHAILFFACKNGHRSGKKKCYLGVCSSEYKPLPATTPDAGEWEREFRNKFGNYGLYADMGYMGRKDVMQEVEDFIRSQREAEYRRGRDGAVRECVRKIVDYYPGRFNPKRDELIDELNSLLPPASGGE